MSTGDDELQRWVPGTYDPQGNWVPGHWQAPGHRPRERHPAPEQHQHPLRANQGYGFDPPWQAGVYGGNSGLGYGGFGPYGHPSRLDEANLRYHPSHPPASAETWGQSWDAAVNVVQRQPRPARDDDELRDEVVARLAQAGYDADAIEVEVSGGEVTLTGTVDSRREKRRAEQVAESAGGVRDIHNRLRLVQAGGRQTG